MAKQTTRAFGDDASQQINILSNGTQIKGDIICNGDIRIDGEMEGNLTAKGKVVVGNHGKIKGEVAAANIEVAGHIQGKVNAKELTNLKASARIEGDIQTGKLSVEPGATFTGSCNMGINPNTNEKEKTK